MDDNWQGKNVKRSSAWTLQHLPKNAVFKVLVDLKTRIVIEFMGKPSKPYDKGDFKLTDDSATQPIHPTRTQPIKNVDITCIPFKTPASLLIVDLDISKGERMGLIVEILKSITSSKLSRALNVSVTSVSQWKRGRAPISAPSYRKLVAYWNNSFRVDKLVLKDTSEVKPPMKQSPPPFEQPGTIVQATKNSEESMINVKDVVQASKKDSSVEQPKIKVKGNKVILTFKTDEDSILWAHDSIHKRNNEK